MFTLEFSDNDAFHDNDDHDDVDDDDDATSRLVHHRRRSRS